MNWNMKKQECESFPSTGHWKLWFLEELTDVCISFACNAFSMALHKTKQKSYVWSHDTLLRKHPSPIVLHFENAIPSSSTTRTAYLNYLAEQVSRTYFMNIAGVINSCAVLQHKMRLKLIHRPMNKILKGKEEGATFQPRNFSDRHTPVAFSFGSAASNITGEIFSCSYNVHNFLFGITPFSRE